MGLVFYKGIKKQGLKGWDATHIDLKAFCGALMKSDIHKLIRIYYYDAPLRQKWDQKTIWHPATIFSKFAFARKRGIKTWKTAGTISRCERKRY